MSFANQVKQLLLERDMSIAELARTMEPGLSRQSLSRKLKRDNLSEEDLRAIAKACDASLDVHFVLNDSGKKI